MQKVGFIKIKLHIKFTSCLLQHAYHGPNVYMYIYVVAQFFHLLAIEIRMLDINQYKSIFVVM